MLPIESGMLLQDARQFGNDCDAVAERAET